MTGRLALMSGSLLPFTGTPPLVGGNAAFIGLEPPSMEFRSQASCVFGTLLRAGNQPLVF
jgi:hypothetical protein